MTFLIAFSPIVCLLLVLNVFRAPSYVAALVALISAVCVACGMYGMEPVLVGAAISEGIALSVWPILLVIVAALFLYQLSLFTGGMDALRVLLSSISTDRRVIVLLVGWGFGGFLEGMAGFGTAVAIPAGMLVAMGFSPFRAALSCLVANGVPTAYGSVGLPISTLSQLTGLDPALLARYAGLQLVLPTMVTPFLSLYIMTGSLRALRPLFPLALLSGVAMSAVEIAVSFLAGPELAVIAASAAVMLAIVLSARFLVPQDPAYVFSVSSHSVSKKEGILALLPFILSFFFLLSVSPVCPFLYEPLRAVHTAVSFYPAAPPYVFYWLTAPGVYIFLAAIVSGLVCHVRFKEMGRILWETVWNLRFTILTLLAVIGTAKIMGYSGMTGDIAAALSTATGDLYPAAAPLLGSLGSFITASATSSGVLFGAIQVDAALATGTDPAWLAAANASGSAVGKMISPQNIAIATGALSLAGKEGQLLTRAFPYYAGLILFLAGIVWMGG